MPLLRTSAIAQALDPILYPGNLPTLAPTDARTWVHPSDGVDPAPAQQFTYINDPSLKFRTLNAAIVAMQGYLVANYDAVDNPDQQGIVYALPGVYGKNSNGELLPVVMRDRVHVQGVGARRCILRGESTSIGAVGTTQVMWPTSLAASGPATVEVLVDYRDAIPDYLYVFPNTPLPWFDQSLPDIFYDDTPEVLDGFTFQGGDVQVLLREKPTQVNYFPAARISNCVFDMRHAISPEGTGSATLNGPYFGVMMVRKATYDSSAPGTPVGYLDGRTLIAHNTFAFARWSGAPTNGGWESESRAGAVGVIDVTNPNCSVIPDPDSRHRGVGSPCLVSNVFRTRPVPAGQVIRPYATLGIGDEDTRVLSNGAYVQTNAFDPSRVGATNGLFFSLPVMSNSVYASGSSLWPHRNCQIAPPGPCGGATSLCAGSAAPQQPAVAIWDGSNGSDPAFVGEYIATNILSGSAPALPNYIDWRILPGSPLENLGVVVPPTGPRGFITQTHAADPLWYYAVAVPQELYLFAWDGEHWGNARVMDGAPDIGFDERGLMIEAGNWANDSNSHNQPGFMHPTGVGASTRYFILPTFAGNVDLTLGNRWLRLHETNIEPPTPLAGDGWISPPGAIASPPNLGSLPVGYRTKYVSYAVVAHPPSQLQLPMQPVNWIPIGVPAIPAVNFELVAYVDVECDASGCKHSFYNLQGLIVDDPMIPATGALPPALLRSNLQGEYR